jgi:hypothetical protein
MTMGFEKKTVLDFELMFKISCATKLRDSKDVP